MFCEDIRKKYLTAQTLTCRKIQPNKKTLLNIKETALKAKIYGFVAVFFFKCILVINTVFAKYSKSYLK